MKPVREFLRERDREHGELDSGVRVLEKDRAILDVRF
jgi:hypothetical protein